MSNVLKKKNPMLNNQATKGNIDALCAYLHKALKSGIFIRFRSEKDDGGDGPLIVESSTQNSDKLCDSRNGK